MLAGYKTYITGAVAIVTAAGAYLAGDATLTVTIQSIVGAVMLMFIRHGVSTGL